MKKKKIIVIYGGPSNEHEVSEASAANVLSALDSSKYDVQKLYLHKDMQGDFNGAIVPFEVALDSIEKTSLVMPILHGTFGEDGTLQKMLEDKGLRYTWSDSAASSLAMNKAKTQEVLARGGIQVPKTQVLHNVSTNIEISFPIIIKPNQEGSSIDLYKVTNEKDCNEIITLMLSKYENILVQEFVSGREFTCGVFEKKGEIVPLLPTEIVLTKGDMFDYTAKYTVGGCSEITPAEVSKEVTERIQKQAVLAHVALGCKDLSRTDMIMKEDGTLVVLEVNTIPGMTKTSFIPAEAVVSGYTLTTLLDGIIEKYI